MHERFNEVEIFLAWASCVPTSSALASCSPCKNVSMKLKFFLHGLLVCQLLVGWLRACQLQLGLTSLEGGGGRGEGGSTRSVKVVQFRGPGVV